MWLKFVRLSLFFFHCAIIITVIKSTFAGFFDRSKVDSIMDESLKMKHFDHPNVLGLIGVCLDAGPAPYMVMPYMANGSLLHYLKKERRNVVLSADVDDDVVGSVVNCHGFATQNYMLG